jgi:hypothetical protein
VSKLHLSGPVLRAEGVIEIGACDGTNILYVRTTRRLCLFYRDQIASYIPKLSPWALRWARELLDLGHMPIEVSRRFGLSDHHGALASQLNNAGLAKPRLSSLKPTDQSIAEKQDRFMRRSSKVWGEEWFDD